VPNTYGLQRRGLVDAKGHPTALAVKLVHSWSSSG
jgi:hypothetical protein